MTKARTNIEIDDGYVQTIMDRYGVRTKTDAVDLALRHLAGQPMTREEARRLAEDAADRDEMRVIREQMAGLAPPTETDGQR